MPLVFKGYHLESNKEAGFGRFDIGIHSPDGKPDVLVEIKTCTGAKQKAVCNDADLKPDALNGLNQIETIAVFNHSKPKPVILCSICIVKKFVAVAMKEVICKIK